MKRLRSFFAVWLVMVFGLLRVISGHEGHAPLPTKGVEVDAERGLVTLSPEAQAALALQLARAESGKLRQTTLAYARVVTPWQQRYFVSSRLPGRISQLLVKSE
jgi:hypothetical protein